MRKLAEELKLNKDTEMFKEMEAEKEKNNYDEIMPLVDELRRDVEALKRQQDGISKKLLMEISMNINMTLKNIGFLDEAAERIIGKRDEFNEVADKLEAQNKILEMNKVKDAALAKFFDFFNNVLIEHKLLKNELEQLQKRIRES